METNEQKLTAIPKDGGGCLLAGPGRGDCKHFIGLPGIDDTIDVYGKPHGWCWNCWKNYQIQQLQAKNKRLTDALEIAVRAMNRWPPMRREIEKMLADESGPEKDT